MSHPQIEEVSDSDPEIDDPSEFLPQTDLDVIRPANQIGTTHSTGNYQPANPIQTTHSTGNFQPTNPSLFRPPPPPVEGHTEAGRAAREKVKTYSAIYPIYFDAARTRAQGRRVSASLAVSNPLAYNVLEACQAACGSSHLPLAFEPDKTHPKDWSNPGRVKVQLYHQETHKPLHPNIKNKKHLYILIAKHLKEHPTQRTDPLKLRIQGLPLPDKFTETDIQRPRGWKINGILPVHSAAVSGGGVKDDFFKEAMAELQQAQSQGQLPTGGAGGGMPDMSALQSMMGGLGGMGGMGGIGGMGGMGGMGGAGSGAGSKKAKKK